MKSVFRFSVIGVLTLAFAAVSFAQDPCADIEGNQAKYKEFTDNYAAKTIEGREIALNAAKSYIEKWGNCADFKQQVDYFKGYIPDAEKQLIKMKREAYMNKLYARFNAALTSENWDEVYTSGKEVLAQPEPDAETKLNVTILLGSIGFDEAKDKKIDKYNTDTVTYAQKAISMIESGATSKNYGLGKFTYRTKTFNTEQLAKSNALGWMNYIIGYLKAYREPKDSKGALPYLYKAAQTNSAPKNYPTGYLAIGNWYLAEAEKIDKERGEKVKANDNTDNDETKTLFALQKGYIERAMDAYARAYNLYGTDPSVKAVKDDVLANLREFYKFRNNGKDIGFDAFISGIKNKTMPDPASQVTPVVEEPAATNTGNTPTPATTKPEPTTAKPATGTKPANGTKPAGSATTPDKAASTATTKTPAKKPAPKKKGTR